MDADEETLILLVVLITRRRRRRRQYLQTNEARQQSQCPVSCETVMSARIVVDSILIV